MRRTAGRVPPLFGMSAKGGCFPVGLFFAVFCFFRLNHLKFKNLKFSFRRFFDRQQATPIPPFAKMAGAPAKFNLNSRVN